jgi:hypothetical protein
MSIEYFLFICSWWEWIEIPIWRKYIFFMYCIYFISHYQVIFITWNLELFTLIIKPLRANFGKKMVNVNLEKDAATIIRNQKKGDWLILCQRCLLEFLYLPCQKKCVKIRKKKIKIVKLWKNTKMSDSKILTKTLKDLWLIFSLIQ